MKIKCNCEKIFESNDHRIYDFSKLPLKQQKWPFPAFSNILKEFTNYQLVKCPYCGKEHKDRSLKLLFFFSPLQLLIGIVFLNMIIVLLVLFMFRVI